MDFWNFSYQANTQKGNLATTYVSIADDKNKDKSELVSRLGTMT